MYSTTSFGRVSSLWSLLWSYCNHYTPVDDLDCMDCAAGSIVNIDGCVASSSCSPLSIELNVLLLLTEFAVQLLRGT